MSLIPVFRYGGLSAIQWRLTTDTDTHDKRDYQDLSMDANAIINDAQTNDYLKAGDRFRPTKIKVFVTKTYNRAGVKILCDDGQIKFTTAGNVVKLLTELPEETITKTSFEVYQMSTYNGHPVLSLKTEDKAVNQKILEVLF